MKYRFIFIPVSAAVILASAISCGKEEIVPEQPSGPADAEEVASPDEWHDKIRVLPYPKMSNELYINPSPLIVPQNMKTGEWLRFQLSQDENFPEEGTITSDTLSWNMFNPHTRLATGTWYWRYCNVSQDGKETWSDTIPFEVEASTPEFVTPGFSTFLENAPRNHPRLYCWLRPYIEGARAELSSHDEYSLLISRAETASNADWEALLGTFSEENMSSMSTYIDHLYQAAYLTEDENYLDRLHEILGLLLARGFSDQELFTSNFCASDIAFSHLAIYDLLYDRISASEKSATETLLMRYVGRYIKGARGYEENHIFDNHFWQRNMRVQFQTTLCLFDKQGWSDEATYMLEYYYELWTARAPASGFNRDGAWINGSGYFNANVRTLAYMPLTLSYISRTDFLQHPWYRSAGESLVYSWLPDSRSSGFGDSSEEGDSPHRQRVAFADFLAKETGDPYAGWYAEQCRSDLRRDTELRLYRMGKPQAYNSTELPEDAPKMKWYKDIGEVVMHSDLENMADNLSLSFRSSTFGSGSHTLADQNSFNLLYKGDEIYYHSGYYTSFSDAHNLMSYRHTRAHNSILVNGIGQPFSTQGYGMVLRADGGEDIAYCLGDASNAYCGISDDPMWIENFAAAGIEQTPENGFGETPLTKYRRQVLMLYPDIVLIYDELEASEPVRWDWLLHSPVQFSIDIASMSFSTAYPDSGSKAVTTFFSGTDFSVSQTDRFTVPPTGLENDPEYPAQWHLTASADNSSSVRILALIQAGDTDDTFPAVTRSGNTVTCGSWSIEVQLDPDTPEHLLVRNTATGSVYSYGYDNPVLGGNEYSRRYNLSSILYDRSESEFFISEMTDQSPISTRSRTF